MLTAIVGNTGRVTLNILYAGSQVCVLMVDTLYWMVIAPLRGKGLRVRSTIEQFVEFGVHSLPIVGLICFLIGAITAMQASYQLARYGATIFIANLVGVGAMRELAPLMTAILITGRSGSAITAEIGTMKVAEEIDALEVMGLNPTKFLIVPKFLAMLLAVPCVTVLAIFIMIFGGFFLSTVVLGLDPMLYIQQTAGALVMKDLVTGMVKSVFFAITICWVGVYRGFQVEGGAEGVGRQTTSSVVTSIFMIIIVDLVFTVFFYYA
ncbi:MAG: transporter permease [Candidatus Hydrogenedentes bacterium]|nr:transporter permease [Candidatus Hydrogenedentota bacterium]